MSRPNIEVVRGMLERWNAGDIEGWLDYWHRDAEWVSGPFEALEGRPRTYLGHAELRRFPADVLEGFVALGQIDEARFWASGNSVLVLGEYRATGEASGADVAAPMGWLFEVQEGKITRGRDFLDQQQALEAAGLSE